MLLLLLSLLPIIAVSRGKVRKLTDSVQWYSNAKAKIRPLTSASIAKKSSNPNLCVGETKTDQQRSNTAKVTKVNITVQSAISSGCLLASRFSTSIVDAIDGISGGPRGDR